MRVEYIQHIIAFRLEARLPSELPGPELAGMSLVEPHLLLPAGPCRPKVSLCISLQDLWYPFNLNPLLQHQFCCFFASAGGMPHMCEAIAFFGVWGGRSTTPPPLERLKLNACALNWAPYIAGDSHRFPKKKIIFRYSPFLIAIFHFIRFLPRDGWQQSPQSESYLASYGPSPGSCFVFSAKHVPRISWERVRVIVIVWKENIYTWWNIIKTLGKYCVVWS